MNKNTKDEVVEKATENLPVAGGGESATGTQTTPKAVKATTPKAAMWSKPAEDKAPTGGQGVELNKLPEPSDEGNISVSADRVAVKQPEGAIPPVAVPAKKPRPAVAAWGAPPARTPADENGVELKIMDAEAMENVPARVTAVSAGASTVAEVPAAVATASQKAGPPVAAVAQEQHESSAAKVPQTVAAAPAKTVAAAPPPAQPQPAKSQPPAPAPQQAPAWKKPESSGPRGLSMVSGAIKDRLNLQSLSGSIAYNQMMAQTTGHKNGQVLSYSYNGAYQRKLGQDGSFSYNITRNSQDVLVKKNRTANSSYNLAFKKFALGYSSNQTGNTDEASDGRVSTNTNTSNQWNLALNALKKAPIAVNIVDNTTESSQSGSAPQSSNTRTFTIASAPTYFKKIKTNITYTDNVASNAAQQCSNENSMLGVNLESPVSKRLTLKTQYQGTSTDSSPKEITARTGTGAAKWIYGFDYKLTKSLMFNTTYTFDRNDSTASSGTARKKNRNYRNTLTLTQGIFAVNLNHNVTDAMEGADTEDYNVTFGLNPNMAMFKTANFSLTNKMTQDKFANPQNENTNMTMSYNLALRKHMNFTSQYTLTRDDNYTAQQRVAATNETRIKLFRMDNPLGKTLAQSLQWQRNSMDPTQGNGNTTNTYTHTIQKNWKKKILKKELSAAVTHNWLLTSAEPTGADTFNKILSMNMGYPLSGQFNMNYTFTFNNSFMSGNGTNANFTKQSVVAMNYKTKRNTLGTMNYTYSGSRDGTKTKCLLLNLARPLDKQSMYNLSLNRNINTGNKQMVFYTGLTLNF